MRGDKLRIVATDYRRMLEQSFRAQNGNGHGLRSEGRVIVSGFNTTGGDLSIGDPVSLGAPLFLANNPSTDARLNPEFNFVTLDADDVEPGAFGIVVTESADGKECKVLLDGVAVINVTTVGSVDDGRVTIEGPNYVSGDEGPLRVVWMQASGDNTVVQFDRSTRSTRSTLIGVTTAEVSFRNSVDVEIYASDTPGVEPSSVMVAGSGGGSEPNQVPQTVTAWFDWIAEDNPEPIPANTDVAIEIAEHGEYRIIRAACGSRSRA